MMHRCFEIPELLEHILSHLETPDHDGTLAALAQTSRVFHEPALNILWRSQDSLANILRCLSLDVLRETSVEGRRVFHPLRPILASDWERLRPYANRVKEFTCGDHTVSAAIHNVQDDLSCSRINPSLRSPVPADGCIFPNLTSLVWFHSGDGFPHICLFLGQKITQIRIHMGPTRALQSGLPIFPSVTEKCPALKTVSFDLPECKFDDEDETTILTSKVISEFIQGLSCVESLTIHIPDMTSLLHLAQLPSLWKLEIHGLPKALSASPVEEKSLFLSLRHLDLLNSSISQATRFVEMCSDATLELFTLGLSSSYTSPRAMQSLFAKLVDAHGSSLTSLEIDKRKSEVDANPGPGDIFNIDSLHSTLRLGNLEKLDLVSNWGFDLDDAAISQMARAWPHLKVLELRRHSTGQALPTRATLRSLQILARHCPRLETLAMDMDTDVVPPIEEPPHPNLRMRILHMRLSPILADQLLPVARFISAIFPNLQDLSTRCLGSYKRWHEVRLLIPVLVAVRQEGRRWAHMSPDSLGSDFPVTYMSPTASI